MNARTQAALVELLAALTDESAPAQETTTTTPPVTVPATKVLSRGAWKTLRLTRKGQVKAAFAGLTREQAFEAGLCPGYHLPTGYVRNVVSTHTV